jgi:hypothetical protein
MALHLPAPLNNILSLWLPPDFTKTDENTLNYVLRQSTLTWEALVVSLERQHCLITGITPYIFGKSPSPMRISQSNALSISNPPSHPSASFALPPTRHIQLLRGSAFASPPN